MNTFFRLYLCLILLLSIFITDQVIVKKANPAASYRVERKKHRKPKHDRAAMIPNLITVLYADLSRNSDRVVKGVSILITKPVQLTR